MGSSIVARKAWCSQSSRASSPALTMTTESGSESSEDWFSLSEVPALNELRQHLAAESAAGADTPVEGVDLTSLGARSVERGENFFLSVLDVEPFIPIAQPEHCEIPRVH